MAAPGGKFFIQDKLKEKAPHHESFQQLWETKWKQPCTMGIYPFMFAARKDFEPVVESITKAGLKEPYDWDEYAQHFFPKAEELVDEAKKAESAGENEKASELYMRASAVYRISRFPAPRSKKQRHAWTEGKKAALRGLELSHKPTTEVVIPHKHGLPNEGKEIPLYYNLPTKASRENQVPLVILFTGLDGYRTELAVWIEGWNRLNVAVIVIEIPGTGDSPADPKDPISPDREWSSLLDWVAEQPEIDQSRKAVWGFSTGGYYAIRIAHTHRDQLAGVVSIGGGCHHMFSPEWLSHVNHLEYPFDLANTLAYKFGYGDDLEAFKKDAMRYSLVNDGTLDKPCTRLLLVNGVGDEIFPIDDYYECLLRGQVKEARFVTGRKHMGEPEAFHIILPWLFDLFGLQASSVEFMKTVPFKAKY